MLERELQRFLVLLLGGKGVHSLPNFLLFSKKASNTAAAAESALCQHSSRQPPWHHRKNETFQRCAQAEESTPTCRGGTVLNALWVVLALVANTAMRPFSFPFFLFLRPHSLGTAVFSLSWFVGQSLSGLSLGGQQQESSRTAAA